jgi:hypothetical protein
MLVGDLVMAVREAITDLPPTLLPPSNLVLTAVVDPNGFIPPGTYYGVMTLTNQWGETLPTPETSVLVAFPNNAIQVTVTANVAFLGALSGKLYLGTAPGAEFMAYTTSPFNVNPFTLLMLPSVNAIPPTRNTSYIPDQDGDSVSAFTMYRWINDALKLGSTVCGGLLDYSGIGSVSGSPQYIVPGLWKKIASMWYDGYPLAMDDNGNYFRRNAITASVLSSVAISTFNNQMMFELWPQPSRTAGLTTLAQQMYIDQTTAVVVNASNFLLSNGFVQIGTEIMSYSGLVGNTLNNLKRALGGTAQSVIGIGQPVAELNLFWSGWRMYQPNFQPGSSTVTVPVPVGWESILFEYGLGRMKLAEQNVGDYSKLTESCTKKFSDWLRQNKVVVGPRQIGDQASGLEVLPNLGGGWVIP